MRKFTIKAKVCKKYKAITSNARLPVAVNQTPGLYLISPPSKKDEGRLNGAASSDPLGDDAQDDVAGRGKKA